MFSTSNHLGFSLLQTPHGLDTYGTLTGHSQKSRWCAWSEAYIRRSRRCTKATKPRTWCPNSHLSCLSCQPRAKANRIPPPIDKCDPAPRRRVRCKKASEIVRQQCEQESFSRPAIGCRQEFWRGWWMRSCNWQGACSGTAVSPRHRPLPSNACLFGRQKKLAAGHPSPGFRMCGVRFLV